MCQMCFNSLKTEGNNSVKMRLKEILDPDPPHVEYKAGETHYHLGNGFVEVHAGINHWNYYGQNDSSSDDED